MNRKPIDLLAAWTVLDNLDVSLDQIGGVFAGNDNAGNGLAGQRAFHAAIAGYLQLPLLRDINAVREGSVRGSTSSTRTARSWSYN